MATYPTSLAPQLNQVPEDHLLADEQALGTVTPSHGGTVNAGHEFDMPIQPRQDLQQPPSPALVPRSTNGSQRPRPMSMPPQSYNASAVDRDGKNGAGNDSGRSTPAGNARRSHRERETNGSSNKPRSSGRILGDYTLSKTLGAGSMGKVKLATHNITGEKVRFPASFSYISSLYRDLACGKNPSSYTTATFKWLSAARVDARSGGEAGIERRIKGNPYATRGRTVHAPSSSLHLWNARDDSPPVPLLHGL